ncbi:MAG TPA: DUF2304 family protein [Candidatus Paceibacterota bacterium]
MIVPVFVTIFVAFAVSRVFFRFRVGDMSLGEFLFWLGIWGAIEAVVWIPKVLDEVAHQIGISRGIDAVVYGSVVLLFYLMYRVYVKSEFIEHEITSLVRRLAIKDKMRD